MCARRPTRTTASSATRRTASSTAASRTPAPHRRRLRPVRHLRGADPRAQMGLRPIVLERGKAGARAHQGHLGPVAPAASSIRSRTCSSRRRERRRQRSPTASCGRPDQRPAPSHAQGRWPSSSRPARRTKILFVHRQRLVACALPGVRPHRHLPARRHGREDARRHRGAGRRDPLRAARRRPAPRRPARRAPGARRRARLGRGTAQRPACVGARARPTARATPSAMLHEPAGVRMDARSRSRSATTSSSTRKA